MTKHWIVNNIMGLSFCLLGIRHHQCNFDFARPSYMEHILLMIAWSRHISLPNFRAGVVLLSGLFVYDVPAGRTRKFSMGVSKVSMPVVPCCSMDRAKVLGVFQQAHFRLQCHGLGGQGHRGAVLQVRPGVRILVCLEAPIKLLLPRDFGGCGEFKCFGCASSEVLHFLGFRTAWREQHVKVSGSMARLLSRKWLAELRFAMLGLGDIAVPGLFCALLAKWDAVKMGEGSSKGFTYLNVILLMYILSLATTIVVMVVFNHAQPALLYICPYLLLGSAAVALARRGLRSPGAIFIGHGGMHATSIHG
eukprot:Skav206224  [mRNA]  locus=scaffold1844:608918:610015:- [translate_table: standard]